MPTRPYVGLGVVLALCVMGVALALATTERSVGIDSDAVSYIDAARHMANGLGLFTGAPNDLRPFIHWPPFFPVALASLQVYGLDPVEGSRRLNAFLFGATILLVGGALLVYTSGSVGVPAFGAALTLATQSVFSTHCVARSEPLFIFLGVAGLVVLAAYLQRPRAHLLAISILCIALAFMTRYVGVALVGAGVIALLVWGSGGWFVRLRDAAILGFGSCLPMLLWMLRNAHYARSATNRKLGFHPVSRIELRRGLLTFADWAFPGISSEWAWPVALAAAAGVIILLGVLAAWKGGRRPGVAALLRRQDSARSDLRLRRLPHVMATFAIVYVAFLVLSISFIDSATPLSDRLLLPAYVAAVIAILCAAHALVAQTRGAGRYAAVTALVVVAGVLLIADMRKTMIWIRNARANGIEAIDTLGRRPDGIIVRLKAMPGNPIIYTNGGAAVHFLVGTYNTRQLPYTHVAGTSEVNRRYAREVAAMKRDMETHGAYLACIDQYRFRRYFATEDELRAEIPLRRVAELPDGVIYEMDREAAAKAGGASAK